jgi:hypothetical protein
LKSTSGYSRTHKLSQREKQPVNEGYRLDGKVRKSECSTSEPMEADNKSTYTGNDEDEQRGMPDFDYKIGLIRLNRILEKPVSEPVTFFKHIS